MARLPYKCNDLAPDGSACYTFTPSQRFSENEKADLASQNIPLLTAYNQKQSACAAAAEAGDWKSYGELKCKRQAHKVIQGGRVFGVRGIDDDFKPGSRRFPYKLSRTDVYQTPITTRTQSTKTREKMKELRFDPKKVSSDLKVQNITKALKELASDEDFLRLDTRVLNSDPAKRLLSLLPERRLRQFLTYMQGKERLFRMADASKDQPALSAVAYDIAFQAALNKKLIEENLPPVSTKVERGQQLAMELPQGQDWPRVMTDTCPQPSRFATLVAFGGKRLQADADSVFTFNMEATMRRIGRAFAQLQEKVGGGAKDREMLDAQKAALYLLPFRLIREELGKHDVTWLSLQFSYGSPAVPCSIEMLFPVSSLQHSMSRGLEGTRKKPNYYTLTDLTVSELASFLMEEPRAKRRGRYLRVME